MKKFNKKGFTIVELVIVIAVIAILSAVLIPTFSNVIENANETAALQEAKNKLSAYVGYMGAEGKALNDGVVFIAEDSNHNVDGAYVYYRGALRKFNLDDVKKLTDDDLDSIPENKRTINIAGEAKALTHYLEVVVDDEDNTKTEQLTYKNSSNGDEGYYKVLFRWYAETNDSKEYYNIQFDDGSKKCNIYGGLLVEVSTNLPNVQDDLAAISFTDTELTTDNDEIELPVVGTNNSTITWTLKIATDGYATYVTFEDNKLTFISQPTAAVTITLTAKAVKGAAQATKDFTFTVAASANEGTGE